MLSQSIKTLLLTLFAVTFAFLFTACDDDSSTGPDPNESQLETYTVEDLPADTGSTGEITYYSLRENSIVEDSDSASTEWDIAFSGTNIYTNSGSSGPGNGGAIVLDQSFDATTIAPSSGYNVDTDTLLAIPHGDENGWYNYTNRDQIPNHTVLPLENKTIVLKTGDEQYYAKMRILSYYKGNPEITDERPEDSRHYTFEYAIQLNGSRELN